MKSKTKESKRHREGAAAETVPITIKHNGIGDQLSVFPSVVEFHTAFSELISG